MIRDIDNETVISSIRRRRAATDSFTDTRDEDIVAELEKNSDNIRQELRPQPDQDSKNEDFDSVDKENDDDLEDDDCWGSVDRG